ncbi:MAG: hypothetical protein IJ513_08460, partial [Bacteroidaceae bacterium]|nr:hypothetical protein [Bacteroidaceae bacterium]
GLQTNGPALDFLTVPFRFQRRITFANLLYCSNCFYPVSMPERLFKLWNSNGAGYYWNYYCYEN